MYIYVYKEVWTPFLGEKLACARETSNRKDPYTVCVLESGSIIGHLPRKTSVACSMFLKKGGTIDCVVTGSRRYSVDLAQGGLEVPCSLIVSGTRSVIDKVQKLLSVHNTTASTQVRKKAKLDLKAEEKEVSDDIVFSYMDEEDWLFLDGCNTKLYVRDQLLIGNGQWLNDKHIYFSQCLLKSQYPTVDGLNCTLYQHKMKLDCSKTVVQIVHTMGDHWIVVSNVDCDLGEVKIYHSLYYTIHEETKDLINSMFNRKVSKLSMAAMQKQEGSMDCGVFCIASLLHNCPLSFKSIPLLFITFPPPHAVTLQNLSLIKIVLYNMIM